MEPATNINSAIHDVVPQDLKKKGGKPKKKKDAQCNVESDPLIFSSRFLFLDPFREGFPVLSMKSFSAL